MSTTQEYRDGYFQALAERGVSPGEVEAALRLNKAADISAEQASCRMAEGMPSEQPGDAQSLVARRNAQSRIAAAEGSRNPQVEQAAVARVEASVLKVAGIGVPGALAALGLGAGAAYLGGAAAGRGLFELTEPKNRDRAVINDFKRRQISDDLNAKLLALQHQRAPVAAPVAAGGIAQ